MVLSKSFRVWRKYRPRSVLLESKDNPEEALLFESNAIAILSPVEVDIIRREHGESLAAYSSLGVLTVNVATETYHYLVLITGCQSVGKLWDAEVFRITQTTFAPLSTRANLELVQDVGKLLASGRFYFAYPSTGTTFDLLSCAQKQGKEQSHFFWNRGLFAYLKRFGVNCDKWLSRVMCGSVEIQTVYAGDKQAKACLISRLSCERAGTRFNVRGTNDEGHVANFVETEQAIYVDNTVASFVQIRGLVPLFWEQPGLQTGGGMIRIKFSRGYTCSQPAFERHFEWCLLHYGPLLCANLLGTRNQEQMLSKAFQEHLSQLSSAYCAEMVCYDYHRYCKGTNVSSVLETHFLPLVDRFVDAHGFYIYHSGTVQRTQTGTIRANCLDCLDRTNSVQSFLGHHMMTQLMSSLGLSTKLTVLSRFEQLFSLAWSRNGDSISRLYAGTRALALEGKMKFKDGARSVQRTILNNFMDNTKQEAIDMLLLSNAYSGELGQRAKMLLDASDALAPIPFKQNVCDRWSDFTTPEKLRVCIGTWNVNGGRHIRSIALKNQSMHDWLLDGPLTSGVVKEHPEEFRHPPDIFAIGFQELVGLTASNIVSASTSNRREWGVELQRVLSRDHAYELLTAEQLVGICLYIFIRPKLIPYIRDVAVSTVKTGMSGKAGNKGAVAIHFLLHASSLCFVCSHFAAHQTRVMERNQDFADIWRKVQFSGQSLSSHDYVFWCGDLNYRIDLPSSMAKDHIAHQRWSNLLKQDQLVKQKKLKKVFHGFIEGNVTFAPTYKYDEFSDDYDTSEKCRTPAWCDRILWRRKGFHLDQSTRTSQSRLPEANSEVCNSGDAASSHWDFGLHPSDAGVVCSGEMEGGQVLVNPGHPWHPGRLLYYNRAELKQSDHRPVVALLEVDVYRVDPKKRAAVMKEVILALGPPDPTVVITEREEGGSLPVPQLLDALRPYGQVVLVRVTDDSTLVTFQYSQSALSATALHGQEIGGVKLDVYLNSPWPPSPAMSDEDSSRTVREGKTHKKSFTQCLKVLTSEQLFGSQEAEVVPKGPEELEEDLVEFSFTEQQEVTDTTNGDDTSSERMEPGVIEPGPSDGTEPGPSDGTEPGASDGTEPGASDGTEPGPSNRMEAGPSDEMKPGPSDGTELGHSDGTESGPSHGTELRQSDEMEPGQTDSGLADELEPVHRDALKQEQTHEILLEQAKETESRQVDVTNAQDVTTDTGVAIPPSSTSSDLAMTGASEQEEQKGHVPTETEKVEPGGMAGFQEYPISMALTVPLPSSSSDEDLTANVISEHEGKDDSIPTSEPQTASMQELSEHPAEEQPEKNVFAAPPPGPNPSVGKESPPPRPPTLPSSTSRERAFTTNENQLLPPKSVSPEKGQLSQLQPRPPRPPRPQIPMRARTNSLPHRPTVSGPSADMKLNPLPLSVPQPAPDTMPRPQAPPRRKSIQARNVAEQVASQPSKPPTRLTQPPKRPTHSPNVPKRPTHCPNAPQRTTASAHHKSSKPPPARPPPPKKT